MSPVLHKTFCTFAQIAFINWLQFVIKIFIIIIIILIITLTIYNNNKDSKKKNEYNNNYEIRIWLKQTIPGLA